MAEVAVQSRAGDAGPIRALDARYYTETGVYDAEVERIFFTTWQYAGHVSALSKAGDYVAFELLGQRLFCLKDREGRVRTFYNVCQHRAHGLIEGSGNRAFITCPYHAWTYGLDGRLKAAPASDRTIGFDKTAVCLTEVRTEVFAGFVFVNLDDAAASMAVWFPGVEAELRAFVPMLDELAPASWQQVPEACNWKVTVENYSECYHCKLNHPTFSGGVIQPETYNVAPQGHCLRHTTRSANLERMTYPIDLGANEHAGEYSSWFLWPSFSFQVYPGNVLNTYLWRPDRVDHTTVWRGWFARGGERTGVLDRLIRQDLETTVAEDIRLVESVQHGLSCRGYRPGPLVIDPDQGLNSEHSIAALHRWYREAMAI